MQDDLPDANSDEAFVAFLTGKGPSPATLPGWKGPKRINATSELTVTRPWDRASRRPATKPVVRRKATVRESHRTRPGHRRSGATSTTSSSDPPDEPAAATLRVRRPSGSVEVFEAIDLEPSDGILWATGRWRRRVGLNNREIRYSQPGVYGFTAHEIVEVRA